MNEAINKEGVTADLEATNHAGSNEVELFNVTEGDHCASERDTV